VLEQPPGKLAKAPEKVNNFDDASFLEIIGWS
jgi:hypothetical protein